jgi:hypothetical protein
MRISRDHRRLTKHKGHKGHQGHKGTTQRV